MDKLCQFLKIYFLPLLAQARMRRVMQEAMFGGRPCAPVVHTDTENSYRELFCDSRQSLTVDIGVLSTTSCTSCTSGAPRLRSMTRAWLSDKRQESPAPQDCTPICLEV